MTPLFYAFDSVTFFKRAISQFDTSIDSIKDLLEISRDSEDFETHLWRDLRLYIADSPQITNWLWDHVMSNSSGSELLTFQTLMFRDIVGNIGCDILWGDIFTTVRILAPKMAKSNLLLDEILMGNINALVHIWCQSLYDETKGQKSGSRYMALLRSLGVDSNRSIEAMLEELPGRILQGISVGSLDRKILFYQDGEQDWVLRWEWILKEEAPGYELLSEFPSMTFDGYRSIYNFGWPFFKSVGRIPIDDIIRGGPKWDARLARRLARRLAKTARKELARTGQKRPRSRMPGAWI
jgi:hypothetical protein